MFLEERIMAIEKTIQTLLERMEKLDSRGTDVFLTVKELANLMGCAENTIYINIRNGTIEATRKTGSLRIPLSQFYRGPSSIVIQASKQKKEYVSIQERVFGTEKR